VAAKVLNLAVAATLACSDLSERPVIVLVFFGMRILEANRSFSFFCPLCVDAEPDLLPGRNRRFGSVANGGISFGSLRPILSHGRYSIWCLLYPPQTDHQYPFFSADLLRKFLIHFSPPPT